MIVLFWKTISENNFTDYNKTEFRSVLAIFIPACSKNGYVLIQNFWRVNKNVFNRFSLHLFEFYDTSIVFTL